MIQPFLTHTAESTKRQINTYIECINDESLILNKHGHFWLGWVKLG